ncbi:hypothetical protein CS542_03000 [Pedobacter sp. IW39]|nr:hypothetical protein CS542_03000 [Pedobacter sp. IW39]
MYLYFFLNLSVVYLFIVIYYLFEIIILIIKIDTSLVYEDFSVLVWRFAICLFAACKRKTLHLQIKPDPLLTLGDSCSYQMDGKSYSFTYQNGLVLEIRKPMLN